SRGPPTHSGSSAGSGANSADAALPSSAFGFDAASCQRTCKVCGPGPTGAVSRPVVSLIARHSPPPTPWSGTQTVTTPAPPHSTVAQPPDSSADPARPPRSRPTTRPSTVSLAALTSGFSKTTSKHCSSSKVNVAADPQGCSVATTPPVRVTTTVSGDGWA